jgi:alpha-glucosidase
VLATGGIRWLAVDDEAVAFVRESAEECVLVFAARAAATLVLPGGSLPRTDAATALFGEARLEASDDLVHLTADGPNFTAWQLPGVDAPAW